MGTDPNQQPDPGVADTAKDLATQAIDAVDGVVDLAVSVPVDTAKLLLSKIEKLASALRDVLPGD